MEQRLGRSQSLSGRVLVEERESAITTASSWRKCWDTLWTDGSRLDNGRVGAAVLWWEGTG